MASIAAVECSAVSSPVASPMASPVASPARKTAAAHCDAPPTAADPVVTLAAAACLYIGALLVAFGRWETSTWSWYAFLVVVTTACVARAAKDGASARCVIVCAAYWHRSVFMHCTVERDCLFAVAPCSPLWGRTVACVGELAMMDLILRRVTPNRARLYVALIAAAECISFVGVIKRQYWWFMFENGTWAVVAAAVAATVGCDWLRGAVGEPRAVRLLAAFAFAFLAVYNTVEDLPMYYRRSVELDHRRGLAFFEGVAHAAACHQVTASDAVWRPQMVWMGLNYTLAPIACLYIDATPTAATAKKAKRA